MLSRASWPWAGLLLIAVVIRGGILIVRGGTLDQDPDAYRRLAETLAQDDLFGSIDPAGNRVPTAFRPPGYPWFLSWWVREGRLTASAVAWLHGGLGVLTCWLTYGIGRRLARFFPEEVADRHAPPTARPRRAHLWVPFAAGLLVAIDPILLVQSTQVMTETAATFLAAAVWASWLEAVAPQQSGLRRGLAGLALGGLLGLAFLTRPAFVVWAGLLVGWLLGLAWFRRQPSLLWVGGTVVLIVAGTIGGWMWRNERAVGRPIWATSHGGYTLLLGNNPLFYDYLRSGRWGTAWQAEPFHLAWADRLEGDPREARFWEEPRQGPLVPPVIEDERADDRLAYAAAKATISRQPTMFLWASLVRLGRLWSPWPHQTESRAGAALWGVGLFYLVLAGLALRGIWALGRRIWSPPWVAGLLLAIALSGVHAVYWSNLRMRAPAIPWLALLAAVGAAAAMGGPLGRRIRGASDAAQSAGER